MTGEAGKIRLIMELRGAGISDTRVLSAIERTPRQMFVPEAFATQAWDNVALPIGLGQTISQPLVVAAMTQTLELGPRHRILEVGTGSGYQAAILALLCMRVYTVERHRALLTDAEKKFAALRLSNVTTRFGDGTQGWPEQAPFDRIIVTACAPAIPADLVEQLVEGGIMLLPVGDGELQTMMKITREGDGYREEILFDVRFVPLVPDSDMRWA